MKKIFLFTVAVLVLGLALTNPTQAQFKNGTMTLGPSIGLAFLGSQPQFGINFESGFSGETYGTWAWGLVGRYWSYTDDFGGYYSYSWKYTNILIGGTVALHFKVGDGKFDPSVGILLAYDISSNSYSSNVPGYTPISGASGSFFFTGVYGRARYWFSPGFAGVITIDAGSASYGGLDIGVDFRL